MVSQFVALESAWSGCSVFMYKLSIDLGSNKSDNFQLIKLTGDISRVSSVSLSIFAPPPPSERPPHLKSALKGAPGRLIGINVELQKEIKLSYFLGICRILREKMKCVQNAIIE